MSAPSSTAPAAHAVAAHLELLLETVPVCLARVAQDGTLLAVNEAGLVLLGADGLGRVLGTRLQAYVASDTEACRRFVERTSGGERGSLELEIKSVSGHVSTVQVSATPIPSPVDGTRSALLVFRDVSEQRRLERSVMESAAGAPAASDRGGLETAVARIEELESALQASETRRLELEALLGARDGVAIDLDEVSATLEAPTSTRSTRSKGKGTTWRS